MVCPNYFPGLPLLYMILLLPVLVTSAYHISQTAGSTVYMVPTYPMKYPPLLLLKPGSNTRLFFLTPICEVGYFFF